MVGLVGWSVDWLVGYWSDLMVSGSSDDWLFSVIRRLHSAPVSRVECPLTLELDDQETCALNTCMPTYNIHNIDTCRQRSVYREHDLTFVS